MIYKAGDNMYQSKINSTMIIDKKIGKVKLEEFDVKVDGFKNRKKFGRLYFK